MDTAQLPHVDEHTTEIAADADRVWSVLLDHLDRSLSRAGAARYARAVGCADTAVSGPRPFAEGSTFPGFRVAAAVPASELVLVGRHRFSSYALIFRLEPAAADRTRVRAETRAAFPGAAGGVYRLLVIGSRGHVVLVRRMLSAVKRRCEGRGVAEPSPRSP